MVFHRDLHGHVAFASTLKARLAAAAQRDGWSCEGVAITRVLSGTNPSDFPGFSCPVPTLSHLLPGMAKSSITCSTGKP